MATQYDLPLAQLREYRSAVPDPSDFDEFWARTLSEARAEPIAAEFTRVETPLTLLDVFDVSFAGFAGDRVSAWLYLPRRADAPLPVMVEYIGYTGGRGLVHEHLLWPNAGYAHLVVDTRGQGSSVNSVGATADRPGTVGPHFPGFMTMGIEDPQRYYYRRVFTDAVRAIEVVAEHPALDPDRILITGGSQGGGITIAVAGLVPGLVAAMPDVPFLADMRRATEITDFRPYLEIAQFCAGRRDAVEQVFSTLAYFDGVNFAARASAPTLFSVALMDQNCPPSTVFGAFNRWAHPQREITVYPYNSHEGGGAFQRSEQLRFAAELLA